MAWTKQGEVLDRLRDDILSERFGPGAWVRLRDVAGLYGTSTMPIREALVSLSVEGLVTVYPHRGARVKPLSMDEFEELYMARLGLEGLAARLGAERMTPATFRRMTRLVEQLEQATQAEALDRFLKLDLELHRVHYAASGRPELATRIEGMKRLGSRYIRRARASLAKSESTRVFHRSLLEACHARDGSRAEQLVRDDLDFTVRYLGPVLFGANEATGGDRPRSSD